ncbi:hypothetical protein [Streptomyces sp. NPDC048565]|uniref:hypothetical protein n=1 Tax=Streptomyces sp. NPDC048565 TaxID=3155266 RepID=UPI00341EAD64
MNPGTTEVAAGPSAPALPLALVAELVGRSAAETGTRPPEVRTAGTGTGRKRRAARRRTAAVRG